MDLQGQEQECRITVVTLKVCDKCNPASNCQAGRDEHVFIQMSSPFVAVNDQEEIEKRLEIEAELNKSKILLSKTKQEEIDSRCILNKLRLQHQDLEEKHNLLLSDMQDLQSSLQNEKLYTKSLLKDKCDTEIEYQRMRREYEANDIIIMSLKEQLRVPCMFISPRT